MTFLFIVLILIGLSLYGLKEYYQVKLGIVPQHTPPSVIKYLSDLLMRSSDSGTLLDLSSGYGKRVLSLARNLPNWDITGVEQSPTPWIIANIMTVGKNFGNYHFFMSDPMTWSLAEYDVIFIHQNEKTLRKWEASIARRLPPGTLLICYKNPLPRIKPIEVMNPSADIHFYLYKKAAVAVNTENTPPQPVLPLDTMPETGFNPAAPQETIVNEPQAYEPTV